MSVLKLNKEMSLGDSDVLSIPPGVISMVESPARVLTFPEYVVFSPDAYNNHAEWIILLRAGNVSFIFRILSARILLIMH